MEQLQLRRVGDDAVMLDCADPGEALSLYRALLAAQQERALEVDELVHGAQTVLVRGGLAGAPRLIADALDELLSGAGSADASPPEPPLTIMPVRYGGEDLAEVASFVGMSVEQVIRRHASREYTVAFIGYSPGFAYLTGGAPELVVPRRATPRQRVPKGAVAMAGHYSAVYPREGPGGWQVIGQTDYPMWDLSRAQPAALLPGGRVRFEPTRDRVEIGEAEAIAATRAGALAAAEPSAAAPARRTPLARADGLVPPGAGLRIIDPGLQTLPQDGGRPGLSGQGIGYAGAADRQSLRRANGLVGNAELEAALELSMGGFRAEALGTLVLALSGAPRNGRITGPLGERPAPHDRAFRLNQGEQLRLGDPLRGMRTILAMRGGALLPVVLGSRSRDTLAGVGPAPLAEGDVILAGAAPRNATGAPVPAGEPLPGEGDEVRLTISFGPRAEWFGEEGRERLLGQSWLVTPRSDRVGVRLQGEALVRHEAFRDRELPSEGLVVGSIQVPPDGQPVLFLADHPTTGGYPVIAVVSTRHLGLIAQLPPGSRVSFVPESNSAPAEITLRRKNQR